MKNLFDSCLNPFQILRLLAKSVLNLSVVLRNYRTGIIRQPRSICLRLLVPSFSWPFRCGSGSADPCLWLMDPDPGGPKTCGSGGSGTLHVKLFSSCRHAKVIRGTPRGIHAGREWGEVHDWAQVLRQSQAQGSYQVSTSRTFIVFCRMFSWVSRRHLGRLLKDVWLIFERCLG